MMADYCDVDVAVLISSLFLNVLQNLVHHYQKKKEPVMRGIWLSSQKNIINLVHQHLKSRSL